MVVAESETSISVRRLTQPCQILKWSFRTLSEFEMVISESEIAVSDLQITVLDSEFSKLMF